MSETPLPSMSSWPPKISQPPETSQPQQTQKIATQENFIKPFPTDFLSVIRLPSLSSLQMPTTEHTSLNSLPFLSSLPTLTSPPNTAGFGYLLAAASLASQSQNSPEFASSSPAPKPRKRRHISQEPAVCSKCGITNTPKWRRGLAANGKRLRFCNACGIWFKRKVSEHQSSPNLFTILPASFPPPFVQNPAPTQQVPLIYDSPPNPLLLASSPSPILNNNNNK